MKMRILDVRPPLPPPAADLALLLVSLTGVSSSSHTGPETDSNTSFLSHIPLLE